MNSMLESEGLLTFMPWRGVLVAELDRQQVTELYAVRTILEGVDALTPERDRRVGVPGPLVLARPLRASGPGDLAKQPVFEGGDFR